MRAQGFLAAPLAVSPGARLDGVRTRSRAAPGGDPQSDVQLPNGKSQRDEILKAEHEQNIKDAAQLVDLANELQQEIEKNESYVLSLGLLKKTDEIEKLVKRIRSRLRHY